MGLRLVCGLAVIALLWSPSLTSAQRITATGGFLWDVQNDGAINNGLSNAYDGMYRIRVGGTAYNGGSGTAFAGTSGWATPSQSIAGLNVTRRVYAPTYDGRFGSDTGWARFEVTLENTSGAEVTTTVELYGNLGSDGGTEHTGSSDGDVVFTTADEWVATDDADATRDPSLAHIIYGASNTGATAPTEMSVSGDNLSWTIPAVVPAGQTRHLIFFAVQAENRVDAENMAEKLRMWSIPEQWDQLTAAQLNNTINWNFATRFSPRVDTGLFDVTTGGSLINGTSDSYDGMYRVDVNGTSYTNSLPMLAIEGGRLIVMPPQTIGSLRVQRTWYVAENGTPVGRASVLMHNTTGSSEPSVVRVWGNLGSDGSTFVTGTSSGDEVFTAGDRWVLTDDASDGGGDPSLAHVFSNRLTPSAASLSGDNLEWTYPSRNVPANDASIISFYAAQGADRAASRELANAIATNEEAQYNAGTPHAWATRELSWSARNITLTAEDGEPYDVERVSGGFFDGGADAYDTMYRVEVATTAPNFRNSFAVIRLRTMGREIDMRGITLGAFFLSRRYFVPDTGDGFARLHHVVGNPATAPATADVRIFGNLGSDGSTSVTGSGDGDTMVENTDTYFATDDADGSGDPSLAHVMQGAGVVTEPVDMASITRDNPEWTYGGVALPARTSVGLAVFAVAAADRATAASRAETLVALGGAATEGLTEEEIATIANFGAGGLDNGEACSDAAGCLSGFCADGVCCDSACGDSATDDCQACAVAAGADADGICGALSAAVAPTITCRAAAGDCDAEETCVAGSLECPADALAAADEVCRPATDVCDAAEVCTGVDVTCPPDAAMAAGTSCRAAAGACDAEETCDGSMMACPVDAFVAAGESCREAAGECDVAETCTGTEAACPADAFMAAGTVCRAADGVCDVEEACTGSAGDCPMDGSMPDGTVCADGVTCNGDEVCMMGTCASMGALDCDDGNACTADACAEPGGCTNEPIAGCCMADADCDDMDMCTTDSCDVVTNTCSNTMVAGCGEDAGMPDAGTDAGDDAGDDAGGDDAGVIDSGMGSVDDDGGCSCAVPGAATGSSTRGWLALAVLGFAFIRRRRA